MRRVCPIGLAILLGIAVPAVAASPGPPETTGGDAATAVREESADLLRSEGGTLAVRWSYPQRFSATVGALFFQQPRDFACATACALRGPIVQGELGTGGGSLSVGYGNLVGEKRRERFFVRNVYVGFALKGSVMRTWGSAPFEPVGQTLAGVRADFTISIATFEVGVFRRVSSAPGEPEWRLAGGLGWGF